MSKTTGSKSKKKIGAGRGSSKAQELEAILGAIAAPMFVVDKDLIITRINDAACKASGYNREEVVGKMTCADLSRTPLCGTEDCTIKNCMRTREAIFGDTEMTTRDGKKVPITAACSPLFDKAGHPIGGIEVIVDRTAAARAAWETENMLSTIGAPMFVTDENLVIQSINDPALSATGYTREEVVGKMTCADLARTPLCGTEKCTIKNCMRTGKIIEGETVMTTRDGKQVPIAAVCSALFDEDGKPYGGMEVIIDRTEAVRQQYEIDNILKTIGAPMFVTDENLLILSINDPALKATGYTREEVVGKMTCADLANTPLCGTENCTIKNCMRSGQVIQGETVMTTRDGKKVPIAAVCSALFDQEGKPYGGIEVIIDQTEQKDTLQEVARLIEAATQGELKERAEIGAAQGDYKALREGINDMLDAIVNPINEAMDVLQAAAEKDLTSRVAGNYLGQLGVFKDNINLAIENLDGALNQVKLAVEQVGSASGQISTGSQALASGASEQASSLEEISSSLEEMAAMTKQNADNANEARNLSQSARDSAEGGNEAMGRMAEAINKIKQSSDETAKIIKTIDEIAFQTNLLALNAAVEAARAGEAGKGFAVVAEEVRNLAMRSAEAAKNTAEMIEDSVSNAESGVSVSEEVAKLLGEIVDGAGKANELIAEIAAASDEQSKGIDQVNQAVAQMNQLTQQNAANSEESASAAEELNSQSDELAGMVGNFRLSDTQVDGGLNIDSLDDKHIAQLVAALQRKSAPQAVHAPVHQGGSAGQGAGNHKFSHGGEDSVKAAKPEHAIPLDDDEDGALSKF